MSDDPAAVLADLTALIRSRNDTRASEVWPDSFIAQMRECERLAGKTKSPKMAAMMRKLAGLWREAASSLPTAGGELTVENDGPGKRLSKP